MIASLVSIIFRADSKSVGSASRASSRISSISARCTTQLAERGTPRASSTNVIADVNFSIESIIYFPATRALSASLIDGGTIVETSPL